MNRFFAQTLSGVAHTTALGTLGVVPLPGTTAPGMADEWLDCATLLLPPEEVALVSTLSLARRVGFVGGRLALRAALDALGESTPAVLRTDRGAPALPAGLLGSISHKAHRAIALVRRATDLAVTVGVDLEAMPGEEELARGDIARRILTGREREQLESLVGTIGVRYREAVRLRFALKEAVYKAIDPYVQRYVPFREVEVFPANDGSVAVHLLLPELERQPVAVRASWTQLDTDLIAMAVGWLPGGISPEGELPGGELPGGELPGG